MYPKRYTIRSELEAAIAEILKKKPKDLGAFLDPLREEGYEIKRGKHIAVNVRAQKRFIRLDSLHEGFRIQDLMQILANTQEPHSVQQTSGKRQRIDLQQKIQEGKGTGYQRWAKVFNLKQMAKVLLFLQENGIHDYSQLKQMAKDAAAHCDDLLSEIKAKEKRLTEIKDLETHIINYSKTRSVYEAYRKAGYSRKFYKAHREEITLYKAAKAAFDQLGMKKIPRVAELNEEYRIILQEKSRLYAQYRQDRDRMKELATAQKNAEMILRDEHNE